MILMGVLVTLGGWNLNQTFSLSKDMVLLKEKVGNLPYYQKKRR